MKLAANLSSLWAEVPYLDRFEAASAAGFEGVAVPLPYDVSAKETKRACMRAGLPVVQISTPPPNYTGGARGFAAVPGSEARFRYDLRRALRYCDVLRVPVLHIMAGIAEGADARATLLANLRHAVETVPKDTVLTLQPQAQEGAYLSDFSRAVDVIDEIGAPNLGLQFHSAHAQMLHEDAVQVLNAYVRVVRHVQLGDAPGGGAPGTGKVAFARLFEALKTEGYAGWVVADYVPGGPTDESLAWMAETGS